MKNIKNLIFVLTIVLTWINLSYSLPIELDYFTSTAARSDVHLEWGTMTEKDNCVFLVERRISSSSAYEFRGSVEGSGTTNEPQEYYFNDRVPGIGEYYYRLKQEDCSGSFQYHNLSSPVFIISFGSVPTFVCVIRQVEFIDTFKCNELTFDITILHTNPDSSGPFEFSLGQYNLDFNPAIANGGTLTYSIVPNSTQFTNPNAIPRNPTIVGNQLRLASNILLGAGNGPIVSTTSSGTRIIKMKLETSASCFAFEQLDLEWRNSTFGNPFTKIFSYIDSIDYEITTYGTYLIDYNNPILPVELSSFTANINRNNVTLNWSIIRETNNSGFDIERFDIKSQIANDWIKVGFVQGSGTTNETKTYIFNERVKTGKYKYRLKQIDFSGNYEYHNLLGEIDVGMPNSYNLSQNYPNPFNPVTNIDYDLSYDGRVSILLYDITGSEVMSLVNEVRKAGYYTIRFDASHLSSGIYYYRMIAFNGSSNFVQTKKLMLVK